MITKINERDQITKMKSIKKITLGVLALASLISVLFITSSPNSSPAQAQTNPTSAAAAVLFTQASAGRDAESATPTIFTVDFNSTNCIAPLGGSVHGVVDSTNYQTFGPTNTGAVIFTTHGNVDPSSASSNNVDACSYAVTVTSSLNCTFTVSDAAATPNVFLTVTKNATNPNVASAGDFSLRGKAFAAEDADFFTAATAGPLLNLDPIPAPGILEAVTSAGAATDLVTAAQAILTVPQIIVLTPSDCDAPQPTSGFSLTSAEPAGSLELALTIATQNPSCSPSGDSGEQVVQPGSPANVEPVALDRTCPVTIGVSHASVQSIDLNTNALKSQCGVSALAYITDGDDFPSSGTTNVLFTDVQTMQETIDLGIRSGTGYPTYRDQTISRITLFITTDCPTVGRFDLAYDVLNGTNSTVADSEVQVTITAAPGSSAACVATPGVATIPGASNFDYITRTPAGSDPATDPAVNPNPPKEVIQAGRETTVNIVVRPRAGRTCNYVISYPESSSALSLKAEDGYIRDDTTTSAGDNPRIGDTGYEYQPAVDGRLDGNITRSALVLQRGVTITFLYETRTLPISVEMNFPDDVVFTTEDQVRYRISIVGACARFTPIIARALGATGTFRSVQAYSGSTLVFDRSLGDIESENSQAGTLLFDVEPVVSIGNNTFPCEVEVEELLTPNGCTVIGSNPQRLQFAENLNAFEFTFAHTCSGLPTSGGGRGITG